MVVQLLLHTNKSYLQYANDKEEDIECFAELLE